MTAQIVDLEKKLSIKKHEFEITRNRAREQDELLRDLHDTNGINEIKKMLDDFGDSIDLLSE